MRWVWGRRCAALSCVLWSLGFESYSLTSFFLCIIAPVEVVAENVPCQTSRVSWHVEASSLLSRSGSFWGATWAKLMWCQSDGSKIGYDWVKDRPLGLWIWYDLIVLRSKNSKTCWFLSLNGVKMLPMFPSSDFGTGHLRCWHRSGGVANSVWSNPSIIWCHLHRLFSSDFQLISGLQKPPKDFDLTGVHQRWCGIGVVSSLDGVLLRWRRGVKMSWVGPHCRCFLVVISFKIGKFHTW